MIKLYDTIKLYDIIKLYDTIKLYDIRQNTLYNIIHYMI